MTPRLSLSGGLQFAHHEYGMSRRPAEGRHASTSRTTSCCRGPGRSYKLGEQANVYAGVARGMREPFFRSIYDPQDYYSTPVPLDPEDVWNVESRRLGAARRGGARAATSSG